MQNKSNIETKGKVRVTIFISKADWDRREAMNINLFKKLEHER
jgi:hypothetical protein